MSKLILAISPDEKLLAQINAHLQEGGRYQVYCVTTGKEAVAAAAKTLFDLVLLDSDTNDLPFMPLTRELIALLPGMKILIYPPNNNPRHPLLSGVIANGYLNKPFFGPEVNEKIAQVLRPPAAIPERTSTENDITRLWIDHPESGQKLVEQLLASTNASAGILLIHRQVASAAGALGDTTSQNIINFLTRYWTNIQTGELFRYLKMDGETKTYLVYATPLMHNVAFALIYHTSQSLIEIRSEVAHIRKAFMNRFANTRELRMEFPSFSEHASDREAVRPEPIPTAPSAAAEISEEKNPFVQQEQLQDQETVPAGEMDETVVQSPQELSVEEIPAEATEEISEQAEEPGQAVDAAAETESETELSFENILARETAGLSSEDIPTQETLESTAAEEVPQPTEETAVEQPIEVHTESTESPSAGETAEEEITQPAAETEGQAETPPSEEIPTLNLSGFTPIEELEPEEASAEMEEEEQPALSEAELQKLDDFLAEMPSPNPELEQALPGEGEESGESLDEFLAKLPPVPTLDEENPAVVEPEPTPSNGSVWEPLAQEVTAPIPAAGVKKDEITAPLPNLAEQPKEEPSTEQPAEEFAPVSTVEPPLSMPGTETPESVEETIETPPPLPGTEVSESVEETVETPPPLPGTEVSELVEQSAEIAPTGPEIEVPESEQKPVETSPVQAAEVFPNFDFKLPWEEESPAAAPAEAEQKTAATPPPLQYFEVAPVQNDLSDFYFEYQILLIPGNTQQLITHDIASLLKQQMQQLHESNGWKCTRVTARPLYLQWSAVLPLNTSISEMIQEIKERTDILIFAGFPGLLKDNLLGEFWAPGYFAVSGPQMLSNRLIEDYISLSRQILPEQFSL